MLKELAKTRKKQFDVTIFQTPMFNQKKGYKQVYRIMVESIDHDECLGSVFKTFNVLDRLPADFRGRYISTGDILNIDEGRRGQRYYQLQPGGWQEINRIHIR
ncbi:YodL domain-containing protein [Bacillus mesophilum]|uniref:YodL-like protein n=1 Tax=Bacillus mesophilum TaxID=1071718 RepID=A0A7V7RNG7_9BACI|nr:YodL domain-containing protein [Bacillus mesophilum]KAB2333547.1 hypothetical protein F7732_05485 [Bacillus mesophilum]